MSGKDEDRSVYYSGHVPDFDDGVVEELVRAAAGLNEMLEAFSSVGAPVSLVWEAGRVVGCDVETNGLLHPVRLHQTVNLTAGAKLLDMGRAALYARVVRAEARGKDTPFWRAISKGGAGVLIARCEELVRWIQGDNVAERKAEFRKAEFEEFERVRLRVLALGTVEKGEDSA